MAETQPTQQNATPAEKSATPAFSTGWRAALVAVAGATLLIMLGHWAITLAGFLSSEAGRYDFSTYYAAAAALRNNLHANIYDPTTLKQAGARSHTLVNPPLPYAYPPLFALLLSPFTILSFRVLSRLWLLANATLWIALTFFFAGELRYLLGDTLRRQPQAAIAPNVSGATATMQTTPSAQSNGLAGLLDDPTPLVSLALAALVCLGFTPAYQALLTGQVNFLVLALLAPIPLLGRRGHERWVGALIALAALIKFTPAILIVYLALRRRWEAVAAALITLAAVSLLCIVIVGPGVFFAAIPQALQVGTGDQSLNHNEALLAPIKVALGLSGSSIAFTLGQYAILGLLGLGVGILIWRAPWHGLLQNTQLDAQAQRAHDDIEALIFGIALCAMVLLSPTAWVHHYVWLLPGVFAGLGIGIRRALTASSSAARRKEIGVLALIALATLALGWGLPYGWDTDPLPHHTTVFGIPLWPGALELRPLGGLALVIGLAILVFSQANNSHSSAHPLKR